MSDFQRLWSNMVQTQWYVHQCNECFLAEVADKSYFCSTFFIHVTFSPTYGRPKDHIGKYTFCFFQHTDPDYSVAYVVIETDQGMHGYGLTFTVGRGTEIGNILDPTFTILMCYSWWALFSSLNTCVPQLHLVVICVNTTQSGFVCIDATRTKVLPDHALLASCPNVNLSASLRIILCTVFK